MQCESGWHYDDLRAPQGEQAIEFGETKIVANCEAKGDSIDLSRHEIVARRDALRFVMLLAICQIYIKQVNFAETRYNFAVPVDEYGGVAKLSCQLRMALYDTTSMHNHLIFACFLLQAFDHGSGDCLRSSIKAGIGPKIRPDFGEAGKFRTKFGSLTEEPFYV